MSEQDNRKEKKTELRIRGTFPVGQGGDHRAGEQQQVGDFKPEAAGVLSHERKGTECCDSYETRLRAFYEREQPIYGNEKPEGQQEIGDVPIGDVVA